VGARILDRLINQTVPTVVAITADWSRARHAGLGGRLPAVFSDLGTVESASAQVAAGGSVLDVLAVTPQADRPAVVASRIQEIVAAVFDCAITDFAPDDMLDDIGLDSMMAMDFRVRVNTTFSIDLPVLEILRGVSVNSLTDRVLADLQTIHGDASVTEHPVAPVDADMEQLMSGLSDDDLRELLAELENPAQTEARGAES
jgi:acyl carrier protein